MKHNFDTILEKVLEARDRGVSLQTLIEKHPEEKGLLSDAWKFVDSFTDEMETIDLPHPRGLQNVLEKIQSKSYVLSPWNMMRFVIPAGLVAVLIIVSTVHRSPTLEVATISPLNESADMNTLNDSSAGYEAVTLNTPDNSAPLAAKQSTSESMMLMSAPASSSPEEEALSNISRSYDNEYQFERSQSNVTISDQQNEFNDVSSESLYE